MEEKCENFRHQRDDYISKMNISEGKIRNEKANREKLQSADSKRLNLLRNFNEDAYKGVQWLRQNKDSENFENPGGIYEPIMTVVRKVFMYLVFLYLDIFQQNAHYAYALKLKEVRFQMLFQVVS